MKKAREFSQEIPQEFLNRIQVQLGDEFNEFRSSLYQPPSNGIRINTLKISPQEFSQIYPNKFTNIPWCSSGFTVEPLLDKSGYIPPGKHIYHIAGLYYMQEPSAMAASEILSPQPGEKVLDLAAAPGGKTTHLAALMKNTGILVANEIHPRRVWDLAENLERCGVTNAVVTNDSPQHLSEHFGEYFDRIMLDAPCSGEGMFRKSETARKEWKPESPHNCSIRQYSILEYTARMVKPGGCIAYTTCTFSTEENEGVIARFLENHSEFDLKIIDQKPGLFPSKPEWINLPQENKIRRTIHIWPHQSQGEGHFIALLLKNASTEKKSQNIKYYENTFRNTDKSPNTTRSKVMLHDFTEKNLNISFEDMRVYLSGTYVYYLPDNYPNLQGLNVIHPGWWLGTIHKNRFSPSHALAMGIDNHQAKNILTLQLGEKAISSYLGGESFYHNGDNAWVLITVVGFPIGWGKRVQNVIKNYYPHGLRKSI